MKDKLKLISNPKVYRLTRYELERSKDLWKSAFFLSAFFNVISILYFLLTTIK